MSGNHVPVLLNEAVDALAVKAGNTYIDATLGAAGHTLEIIRRGGTVLGIDQDVAALDLARTLLTHHVPSSRYMLAHGNFRNIEAIAKNNGIDTVAGILFDLGISSMQLDSPNRGISYRFTDAPLDVRMDTSGGDTAAQLVNRETREGLYDIFSTFGEEQLANLIADAIVFTRAVKPLETVGDLVGIIERIVPNERQRLGVLSRVFQAIRIAVNDELESIKKGLEGAGKLLVPGGRLAVISFHSLEDRIVKQYMRGGNWEVLTRHPIRPSEAEIAENSKSRSAKLRIAVKKV